MQVMGSKLVQFWDVPTVFQDQVTNSEKHKNKTPFRIFNKGRTSKKVKLDPVLPITGLVKFKK